MKNIGRRLYNSKTARVKEQAIRAAIKAAAKSVSK